MQLTLSLLLLAIPAFIFNLPTAVVWLVLAAIVVSPFELILMLARGPAQA